MKFYIALLGVAVAFGVALFALDIISPGKRCLATERQMVLTFPNAGLAALGPAYAGAAWVRVYVEQNMCVRWQE